MMPANKGEGRIWKLAFQNAFNKHVYSCSWSKGGFMVAVTGEGNETTIFKQSGSPLSPPDTNGMEVWKAIQQINEKGEEVVEPAASEAS